MASASTSKALASDAKSADISRAEYLKKYLSSAGSASADNSKSKKKSKKKDQPQSGKGMRLLEEDTFLPLPPPEKRSRMPLAFVDKTINGDRWEEDEDEDELLLLNAQKELAASRFKADSFVTIDDKKETDKGRDVSPVRRIQGKKSTKRNEDSDNSPVRLTSKRVKENCSSDDMSPPRRIKQEPKENFDSDLSPQRHSSRRPHKRERRSSSRDASPPRRRTGVATTSGVVSPSRIKIEPELMPPVEEDIDGRYAETRKRTTLFNKTRRSNRKGAEDVDPERKERESKKQEELDAKYKGWNKGVAQIKEREVKLKEMEEVIQEGFARYADNEAMNEHLKDKLLEDDPMADYFKTKKHKVQMRSGVVFPEYKGSWPPNRFSIAPGYRWDGVNRSNGFEGKMSLVENKRRAQATETYKSIIECED
uniref:BUD13 homolog n=1 Tax=Ditylenchus dipsaci TaxID=166011 RepID=A0A915CRA2_9BILA